MGSVDAICTWLSDPRAADTEQHDAGSADRRRHEFAEDGLICPEKVEAAPAGYYDLILMDIMMPRMDGPEAGMNAFAEKPIFVDRLFETMRRHLPMD